ncbi:hypothetical protein OH724_26520, partial [Escherichia coli]
MSEKTVTGEPRIKRLSGIGFRIPAAPASLTFRVARTRHRSRRIRMAY